MKLEEWVALRGLLMSMFLFYVLHDVRHISLNDREVILWLLTLVVEII